jgi:putative tricarboxylic transport membrane protein
MGKHIRKGDFYSGLALAALGGYIVSEAWRWTYMGEEGPGAGFFPMWYGIAMVLLSALLVAGAVLKPGASAGKSGMKWQDLRRALTCWAAFSACIALLNVLGFAVSFALLTWFIIAIMFGRPQRIALSVSIGGAVGFYLLFSVGLGLSLPSGWIL